MLLSCRSRFGLILCGLLFLPVASGCTPVLLLGYLIGGPPMTEPDFRQKTKRELFDKKKPIAVVCYAPDEIRTQVFESRMDKELAIYVTKTLAIKLAEKKLMLIDPDLVYRWIDENPNYTRETKIGEALKCGYVVHLDVRRYSLYEENTTEMYRGRSDVVVTVWDVDQNKDIYTTTIKSEYPLSVAEPADNMDPREFKQRYLTFLADRIGQLFYPVETGAEIPNRVLSSVR